MLTTLDNIKSVLLCRPRLYVRPTHPLRHAVAALLITVAADLAFFEWNLIFVAAASVFAAVALVLKVEWDAPGLADSIARAVFAAACASWIPTITLAIDADFLFLLGLYAGVAVWLQIPAASTRLDPGAASNRQPRQGHKMQWGTRRSGASYRQSAADREQAKLFRDAVGRQFVTTGPAIGKFLGSEIAAFLVDAEGRYYDYVGCVQDPRTFSPAKGQQLVSPGIIYQLRQPIPD